ncbi:hypothetical protein [Paenibacillus sp. BC26]|uniref:hypothetical protein n=1 Tax=Paenibacillus sp. BC26 TaxID=1881032 RepID=UPI0008EEFE30|nr:hypothetical protein [Paenibacillus sp. BC26]SFT19203.1 hypothetical protein SAMN05428962_5010 [Paenibacillus sp. BC26]
MKRGFKVVWDNHFEICIRSSILVEVWMQNELEDIGIIESYSTNSFKINGGFYFRENVLIIVQ